MILLVAGWFGEIGEEFNKITTRLAKEAAAGDFGRMEHLLVNINRKGGAFPIMLQQFRRAITVTITRDNTCHKIGRLHHDRATPEQAKEVIIANLTGNK